MTAYLMDTHLDLKETDPSSMSGLQLLVLSSQMKIYINYHLVAVWRKQSVI